MKDPNKDLKQFITQALAESEGRIRDELKEFISLTVVRSEGRLRKEFGIGIDNLRNEVATELASFRTELASLRADMIDGFAGVAEAIDNLSRIRDEDKEYVDRMFGNQARQIDLLKKKLAVT